MYTHGWLILTYARNQHHIVKQLSFIKNKYIKKKCSYKTSGLVPLGTQVKLNTTRSEGESPNLYTRLLTRSR